MALILTKKEWQGIDLVTDGIRVPACGRHWIFKYGELYDFGEKDENPGMVESIILSVAMKYNLPIAKYESKEHKRLLIDSANTTEEVLISQGMLAEAMKKAGVTKRQILDMADRDLWKLATDLKQLSSAEIAKSLPRYVVESIVFAALDMPVPEAPPRVERMTEAQIKHANANKLLFALRKIGVIKDDDTTISLGGRDKLDDLAIRHLTSTEENEEA